MTGCNKLSVRPSKMPKESTIGCENGKIRTFEHTFVSHFHLRTPIGTSGTGHLCREGPRSQGTSGNLSHFAIGKRLLVSRFFGRLLLKKSGMHRRRVSNSSRHRTKTADHWDDGKCLDGRCKG